MKIVWFKRDLRISDNLPLKYASSNSTIIPLYIIEPELWRQPDLSYRQYEFLKECLIDLNKELENIGQSLIIKVGSAIEVLENLKRKYDIKSIVSHQETWNSWTYERDKAVKKWTKKNSIIWTEMPQNGVIRRLKDRDGWGKLWYKTMSQKVTPTPEKLTKILEESENIPKAEDLGLINDNCNLRQIGGRSKAIEHLESFLYQRGEEYTKEMSSPITAFETCSRLSTYIAFGAISIKEIFHAVENRKIEIKNLPYGKKGSWSSAMRSFSSRLRWHCHFIQKLEDEPEIEFQNMHKLFDGIRENSFNELYFDAWKEGRTGFPMVDACMRALHKTGWINFRMRAMLISFASNHLWLHWRKTSLHLAKLFTDYEPGIHYSQVQMQSGTTGINSIRIYNPIKQGVDQDPYGIFIRKWIPELNNISDENIHTPWGESENLNGYPAPIIDEKEARKYAADVLYGLRKNPDYKKESFRVLKKHASRKTTSRKK